METVTDFIFLGSKISADGDCSHEIKRRLLLGSKIMTKLDSTLKNGDITLPTKVHLVKAMVFPVVMYGCKSWTIKKAELQRIGVFELWCWRKLLRVPWTAARQASLSITNSRSLLKLMSIESMMPSNHLILCCRFPPAFNLFQHQGLFSESVLHIRWPKYWSFSFTISPSNEYLKEY